MSNSSDSLPYDVFLSHGSPDKPWVRTLSERLSAAGIVAYLDEIAIEAGDNFVCNLSDGIGRTSTFVIVVSRSSMERPWVVHEWTSFMATHGPKSRIIPVLLDDVALPPFLRPYQVVHAIDRDVDSVVVRIARAVGQSGPAGATSRYTGQNLIFTIAVTGDGEQLAVTVGDGRRRTVSLPWRQSNSFGIALMDFERLTPQPVRDDGARARLVQAAQTIGAALFDALVSHADDRLIYTRATAPGPRPVMTIRSDDDMLLSLPWELLFHDSRFLVRDGIIDLVRSTSAAVQFETQLTPPREPFTVVTNISAPEGSALSYEAESFRITHALTDHCPQTPTELGTLEDLVETVERAKPRGISLFGTRRPWRAHLRG